MTAQNHFIGQVKFWSDLADAVAYCKRDGSAGHIRKLVEEWVPKGVGLFIDPPELIAVRIAQLADLPDRAVLEAMAGVPAKPSRVRGTLASAIDGIDLFASRLDALQGARPARHGASVGGGVE